MSIITGEKVLFSVIINWWWFICCELVFSMVTSNFIYISDYVAGIMLFSKVCLAHGWQTNSARKNCNEICKKIVCSGTVIDINRQWCRVCGLMEYIPQLVRLHSKDCSWEKSLNSLALRQQSHTSDMACWRICKGEGLEMSFGFVFLKCWVTCWETDFDRNFFFFFFSVIVVL